LHLVGCLYYLYQWCTVKQVSDNEIYLLFKYTKSILWRVAKRLSYIEDAWCLKVKVRHISSVLFSTKCHLFHNFISVCSNNTIILNKPCANIWIPTWSFKVKTEQDESVCYNVNQQMHTHHYNYSNVLIYKLPPVPGLTDPSLGNAQLSIFVYQCALPGDGPVSSENMGVCILKHYCNSNAVCAICRSHCTNCIIIHRMENVKDISVCHLC